MINTYSGERIEPRVGDVVFHKVGGSGHITFIHDDGGIGFCYGLPDEGCTVDSEDCTLLHRPFQVGDEVEVCLDNYGCGGAWFEDKYHVSIDGGECIRHKNPSWHDHPDYEGKK